MAKKMLINVMHPEESRIAIVEEGHLIELDIETAGREQTRGNVYKGVVVRVEPGLQAAFVDIGMKKLGFLQMGEIHPDCWQWRDDATEEQKNRRPRIQEILRRGQELIVQVEKGEREGKGAALTTYISLPGRYMVLMPGSDSCGVSRKVENEADRKKLKETVAGLGIPEGCGYIMRTEAVGRRKTELAKDLSYLLKLYDNIKERSLDVKGPALIYQESDLVIRTIRDYFSAEIEEVLVDSVDVYKQARAFFKEIMPKHEKIVKLHQEKRPIFARYQLEEQIDLIYEKKVPLKSGGSIVVEPTEALVSIDVNSGKTTGEKGVEDTAFKTNMEAAEEVARQLRLRDLGGLIVIDFIDMRDRKHRAEVEKTLKNALKADKARVSVDKISQFGLLEMSRQRIKQTINEASYLECPHCGGHGRVKSIEAMALSFLRKVHTAASRGNCSEVRGSLPLEVAYYLLNRKKRELAQIETDYDIEVTIKGKPSFMMNQMELEQIKREKQAPPAEGDHVAEQETGTPAGNGDAEVAAGEREESKTRKKRRRGKKKPQPSQETATGTVEDETSADSAVSIQATTDVMEEESPAQEQTDDSGTESAVEATKKKRRRRRKRSAKPASETEGVEESNEDSGETGAETAVAQTLQEQPATDRLTEAAESPEIAASFTVAEFPPAEEPPVEVEAKPKRKPRKPRTKPAVSLESSSDTSAAPPDLPASQPVPDQTETVDDAQAGDTGNATTSKEEPSEKPKRKRTPRKKAEPAPKKQE